ncbi:MAG: tripartite tricarboxylate transporter substrate binding protein [Xanthobacteraceae bacterium]|nr:tripartite tricarboxylate transporter substrate binding protein [Xanthobacteraceae bacterium]
MTFRSLLVKTAAALLALTTAAAAQQYPTKPIRLIIPFPPGGSNDVVGRLIAQQLTERLGRQIIVDNRAGAGGVIGTELASQAPKDGYTLAIISIAHAVNPWLYDLKGRYDPIKSFTPIAALASGPNVLVVNPSYQAKNVKELIELAKKSPGKVGWASAGVGSFQHLGGALFEVQTGVKFLHVPFKGGGPAMIDVVAGHNPVMFSSLVQTTPQIQSGKLRPLGVGGTKPSPILPGVPTIAEAGVPGYEATNWWGIVAPAGVPQAVVDRLRKEIAAVQTAKPVLEAFAKEGADVLQMSQAEFAAFMASEMAKWEKVVKASGMKAE